MSEEVKRAASKLSGVDSLSLVPLKKKIIKLKGPSCINLETKKQLSVEWRGTRYRHSIGFLGHGQLSYPITYSARATSVSLYARPVSVCMAVAPQACYLCESSHQKSEGGQVGEMAGGGARKRGR
jgi:hypothetical protein